MFYGVINESYDYTEHLEMELENSLLFFKSLEVVQESGIQIVQESFSDIVEKVKELWNRFKEWVKGIWEKIKNFFGKFKKKSESKTEEKIVQSLQNPQVAPKGSGGVSDEEAEKAAKKIKDNWDKIEKLQKETDKELDKLQGTKKDAANNISERHKEAEEIIKDALKNIYEPLEPIDNGTSNSKDNSTAAETNVLKAQREIEKQLDNLLKDEKEEVSVEDIKEIIKKNAPSPALPNNSKIFYIEDKGYDDNWKNTEYMDFSEGCRKLLYKRDFNNFEKFPFYYYTHSTETVGSQHAFSAEDTVKIDKEVEDFFTKSFGALYNASDDEIVIKQKPKESDVQKFAKDLGDILIATKQCASITFNLSQDVNRYIDRYQSQLDKFTKNAAIVSRKEYDKAEDKYLDNLSDKSIPYPGDTMLVKGKYTTFDRSSVAKFIAKDIANMKKYISLLFKMHSNCVKVYNYDINFAKSKMFSGQIRRLEGTAWSAPSSLPMYNDKFTGPADFRPKE